jgi:hypothetical protein
MYHPHDIPLEMGGTVLVPGSHFRQINEGIAATRTWPDPDGLQRRHALALHHGIWHCGRRNQTGRIRYMAKLRLNPTERQLRLWNTDDPNDPEGAYPEPAATPG